VLGNKRALELHQHLLELLEWLAGDEHGREEVFIVGRQWRTGERTAARGGARGGGGLSKRSSSG
jgi:hypothetical protein